MQAPTISELRRTASWYARRGWPVFPCWPGSKEPMTANGFKAATTSQDAIDGWWQDGGPAWNVAIATGCPGPDVLDVDSAKDGGSAWGPYKELKHAGFLRGAQMLVRTRSGGLHVYFAGTAQRNSANIGRKPLDFRAAGGYVIAAPSVVGDGAYTILEHRDALSTFDLARAKEFLTPPRQASRARKPLSELSPGSRGLAGFIKGLKPQNERGPGDPGRHEGFFWAACRVMEDGTDPQAIIDAGLSIGLDEAYMNRALANAARTVGVA